jgi:hypothetical protein
VVTLGTIGSCLIAYHFGRIAGAEEVRDALVRGDDGRSDPPPPDDQGEPTQIQCRGCLKDVRACTCPKVLTPREGSC